MVAAVEHLSILIGEGKGRDSVSDFQFFIFGVLPLAGGEGTEEEERKEIFHDEDKSIAINLIGEKSHGLRDFYSGAKKHRYPEIHS